MVKIVIPLENNNGLSSKPSDHFGRASYYYLGDNKNFQIIPNTSDHFGGTGKPPERLISLNINVLITKNMGAKAIEKFQNADVAVYKLQGDEIEAIIMAYHSGKLAELTTGCSHSKNH